jgi:hypothetical protein
VKQQRLLRDVGHLPAQLALGDHRDVVAVDEDAALLHVDEAQHELREGRLAGPRRTDEADALARLDAQVEAAKQRMARHIGERDALERDRAGAHCQRLRARPVPDRRLALQHVRHRPRVAERAHDVLERALHRPQALEQQLAVRHDHEDRADRLPPFDHRHDRQDDSDHHHEAVQPVGHHVSDQALAHEL